MKLPAVRLYAVLSTVDAAKNGPLAIEVGLRNGDWDGTTVTSMEGQRDVRPFLLENMKTVQICINNLNSETTLNGYHFNTVNYNTQLRIVNLIEMLKRAQLFVLDSSGQVNITTEEKAMFDQYIADKIADLQGDQKVFYVVQTENIEKTGKVYIKNMGTRYSRYFQSGEPNVTDECMMNTLKAVKSALTKEIRLYGKEPAAGSYDHRWYNALPDRLKTMTIYRYEFAKVVPLTADEQKEMNKVLAGLDSRLFASTMGIEGA